MTNIADNKTSDDFFNNSVTFKVKITPPSITSVVVNGGAYCNSSNSYCDGKNIVITGTTFNTDAHVLGFDTGIIKSCTRNSSTQFTCVLNAQNADSSNYISVKNVADNKTSSAVNIPISLRAQITKVIVDNTNSDSNTIICVDRNNYCKDKEVTITGKNFDHASVLGFPDGVLKSCTKNSETQITCVLNLQDASKTYYVQVSNSQNEPYDLSLGKFAITIKTLKNNDTQIYSTGYSNDYAFATLKSDGTVVTSGNPSHGGDSSSVQNQLTNVVQIYSTRMAYAALKSDGTVVTWGYASWGGDSSSVQNRLNNVVQIYSNNQAFAALKSDGTVVTWGMGVYGGDSSRVQNQLNNVVQIYSDIITFAALKSDGTVVTWGEPSWGGNSSSVQNRLNNVVQIYPNNGAYAALKSDGTVVTWGSSGSGGDSSGVQTQLNNVVQIYSNGHAFAALKSDGTVVTWGDPSWGGDSSSVQNRLNNVVQIYSNGYAFAALKSDGTVVTWGADWAGGDSSWAQNQLNNVVKIYSTFKSYGLPGFAALKRDGTTVTW